MKLRIQARPTSKSVLDLIQDAGALRMRWTGGDGGEMVCGRGRGGVGWEGEGAQVGEVVVEGR